jgi:DNA-binding response OmpR family regulator
VQNSIPPDEGPPDFSGRGLRSTSSGEEGQSQVVRPCGRIVLIEDNPADVSLFRWALEEQGIREEVEVFSHGDVAMAFARQRGLFRNDPPPDVIVIDLNLPGFDGLQILGAICRNPIFCRTEVGIYSSSDDPADRHRAMELGADFYIEKPVDMSGLRALAQRVGDLLPATVRRRNP